MSDELKNLIKIMDAVREYFPGENFKIGLRSSRHETSEFNQKYMGSPPHLDDHRMSINFLNDSPETEIIFEEIPDRMRVYMEPKKYFNMEILEEYMETRKDTGVSLYEHSGFPPLKLVFCQDTEDIENTIRAIKDMREIYQFVMNNMKKGEEQTKEIISAVAGNKSDAIEA